MPSIAGKYNHKTGVLLQIAILLPENMTTFAEPMASSTDLSGGVKMFMALLDTGASVTCISKNVIDEVQLDPVGKTRMSGATGVTDVDQYNFCVGFISDAVQQPSGIMSGALQLHWVEGCEFSNHGFGFDVLLGRDILCRGVFSISFDGHFVLSF